MRRYKLIVPPANLLIELDIRSAAQTASLSVLVKNAGDEERVITDVCAKQKCLLGSRASQRYEHIGNILLSPMIDLVRHLQLVRPRERFEQRADIITKLAVANPALLQNVAGKNIKIKLRRYPQMAAVIQDRIDQTRMIENRIACLDIAQQIHQRNLVGLRTRQRAHDEVEIGCGKPRPTIRSDHRDFIMGDPRPCGK